MDATCRIGESSRPMNTCKYEAFRLIGLMRCFGGGCCKFRLPSVIQVTCAVVKLNVPSVIYEFAALKLWQQQ